MQNSPWAVVLVIFYELYLFFFSCWLSVCLSQKRSSIANPLTVKTTINPADTGAWLNSLTSMTSPDESYTGDVWGTRGNYNEGMIYLSRMSAPSEMRVVKKKEKDTTDVSDIINNNLLHHDDATENDKLKSKKRCAAALSSLSWNKGFESQIVKEGGLKAIITLSNLKDSISQMVSLICELRIVSQFL